ncbi:hypothetical protein SAMN05216574_12061 [Blastococcus tunisiensis]|uniref:PH domain-containing protein n=1 Tax=Blastococcus tunisiensis TaxID=1798228 RepID=A0A1I2KGF5_9ACTN|nr:hypothetical protein SAMN05216574_12061 [Blastococcus sp. DSM 46838]
MLVIRPPRWVRLVGPVVLLAWLSVFVVQERGSGFLVVGGLIALAVAVVVGRLLVTSVIGTADGRLTVRNTWSTRTFLRPDLLGVEVDRAGRGWAVWLVLDDGTRHRLDVTEVPFLGPSSATLERQAGAVRGWLDGRPPPATPVTRDTR